MDRLVLALADSVIVRWTAWLVRKAILPPRGQADRAEMCQVASRLLPVGQTDSGTGPCQEARLLLWGLTDGAVGSCQVAFCCP